MNPLYRLLAENHARVPAGTTPEPIRHILASGKIGTGRTTLFTETARHLMNQGIKVVAVTQPYADKPGTWGATPTITSAQDFSEWVQKNKDETTPTVIIADTAWKIFNYESEAGIKATEDLEEIAGNNNVSIIFDIGALSPSRIFPPRFLRRAGTLSWHFYLDERETQIRFGQSIWKDTAHLERGALVAVSEYDTYPVKYYPKPTAKTLFN